MPTQNKTSHQEPGVKVQKRTGGVKIIKIMYVEVLMHSINRLVTGVKWELAVNMSIEMKIRQTPFINVVVLMNSIKEQGIQEPKSDGRVAMKMKEIKMRKDVLSARVLRRSIKERGMQEQNRAGDIVMRMKEINITKDVLSVVVGMRSIKELEPDTQALQQGRKIARKMKEIKMMQGVFLNIAVLTSGLKEQDVKRQHLAIVIKIKKTQGTMAAPLRMEVPRSRIKEQDLQELQQNGSIAMKKKIQVMKDLSHKERVSTNNNEQGGDRGKKDAWKGFRMKMMKIKKAMTIMKIWKIWGLLKKAE